MANAVATLTTLLRKSTIEDHSEVLQAADAVLKSSKHNQEALHTRVIALLKLDRFEDALRALDDGGNKLTELCVLEKAYALYKTGKSAPEKVAAVQTAREQRGMKHIAAQAAYRAENFKEAARIYKDLSSERAGIEGEENDLRINSSATDAQLEWQGNGGQVEASRKKPTREDLEAFETSYNAACGCIARGDYSAGVVLLKRARDLCEALEELSDEEKRAEVLPIMVQQAFVWTKMGKTLEADAVTRMIEIADVPEPSTRVIAQNNALATSTKDDNPYMTQRLFNTVPTLSPTQKLFSHQSSTLERNKHTIALYCHKHSGVASSTLSQILKHPTPTLSPYINTLSVLNATAHTKSDVSKGAVKKLLELKDKRPSDIGLLLTLTQLYVQISNPLAAIPHLEAFFSHLSSSSNSTDQSIRHTPGLVALITSLYRLCNRQSAILKTFREAATYWLSNKNSNPPIQLLYAAGKELLSSPKPEDAKVAREIFTYLHQRDPEDRIALAGHVAAFCHTDPATISREAEKLTPISQLTKDIDAESLLSSGVPTLPSSTPPTSKKRPAPSETPLPREQASEPAPKKIKTRESKLPKDFDPDKTPDPERWLPRRDQSTFRAKGRKGKRKGGNDMMQGGVVKEEGKEGKEGEKVEKVEGGRGQKNVGVGGGGGHQGAGGGAGKKKKGKGKR